VLQRRTLPGEPKLRLLVREKRPLLQLLSTLRLSLHSALSAGELRLLTLLLLLLLLLVLLLLLLLLMLMICINNALLRAFRSVVASAVSILRRLIVQVVLFMLPKARLCVCVA
jgi:hypothetical protein